MSKLTAMIIDDDEKSLKVLEQLLRLEDVEVRSVKISSKEDLSNLQNFQKVNVIFLDLTYPHTTGYELLELLQGKTEFEKAIFVAYTVKLNDIAEIYDYGFDSVLGKPLSTELFPAQWGQIVNREKVTYIP